MFQPAGKNEFLNGLKAVATRAALFKAYSATGATNEFSGGSYARQVIAFNTPSSGTMSLSGTPAFSVPSHATDAVSFVGLFNTAGSTFYGMFPVGGTPREYWLDGSTSYIYVPTHGWANDDRIILMATTAGGGLAANLPTPVSYYITSAETNRFRIATGTGGSGVVNFTDVAAMPSSDAYVQKYSPEVFTNGGTFTLNTFDIALPW